MNTGISKKISQILRLSEVKDDKGFVKQYIIETRDNKKGAWERVFQSSVLKKTLNKKHFFIHFAIRHLGYGPVFLQRQKKRRKLNKG
jgi:hypothetical protein